MWGCEYQMSFSIDKLSFALSIRTPQHEHEVVAVFVERFDSSIGQFLPPFALVTTCVVCFDGERCIQQQYALLCPWGEVSCGWDGFAYISIEFTVYVLEGRRNRYSLFDGEAESLCLSDIMIRVLSYDDDSYLIERAQVESSEYLCGRGEALACLIGMPYKLGEQLEIRFIKLGLQHLSPTLLYAYVHLTQQSA